MSDLIVDSGRVTAAGTPGVCRAQIIHSGRSVATFDVVAAGGDGLARGEVIEQAAEAAGRLAAGRTLRAAVVKGSRGTLCFMNRVAGPATARCIRATAAM